MSHQDLLGMMAHQLEEVHNRFNESQHTQQEKSWAYAAGYLVQTMNVLMHGMCCIADALDNQEHRLRQIKNRLIDINTTLQGFKNYKPGS